MKIKSSKFGTKKSSDSKLSLTNLIWFGFNYTVGIAFTAAFSQLMLSSVVDPTTGEVTGDGLGLNLIWIFLIGGIIAGSCAWAYNKLSRVHAQSNGASYIYTRTNYGRFWGWMISFLQYSTLPVIVTSQIVSMIRINFLDPGSVFYADWGSFTYLYLDLIGIAVYGLSSCALFFGIKKLKKFINYSSYIKWGTAALLMLAVIVLNFKYGGENYSEAASNTSITMKSFSDGFSTCFFFFLGFETYSTVSKNVENPEKNVGRSAIWVIAISTIFYLITTILFIGAIGAEFSDNPNMQIFDKFNSGWIDVAGGILMIISVLSLKMNAGMQNAFYSGGILEPQAVEGYIPEKYKELNEDNLAIRASILNLILTFCFLFIWLIIPDIISGATGQETFGYNDIIGTVTLILLMVYSFVISIALKLTFENKIDSAWWEIALWIITGIFIVWQVVQWFVVVFENISSVTSIMQLSYITLIIGFAVIWYFAYYNPKYKKRLKENPKYQKELDDKFMIVDDWNHVSVHMQHILDKYLKRSHNIHADTNNENYKFAESVHKDMKLNYDKNKDQEPNKKELKEEEK
ncbi:APC family permease [Spiroplasma endosymbiont of Amphibalanus improvisus]|uniref:APC family permease n=1 Tax=Spiroplasma endosymbiont of Amphibalanus improvisus TaxID=3066327 RepID=UPI00313E3791